MAEFTRCFAALSLERSSRVELIARFAASTYRDIQMFHAVTLKINKHYIDLFQGVKYSLPPLPEGLLATFYKGKQAFHPVDDSVFPRKKCLPHYALFVRLKLDPARPSLARSQTIAIFCFVCFRLAGIPCAFEGVQR